MRSKLRGELAELDQAAGAHRAQCDIGPLGVRLAGARFRGGDRLGVGGQPDQCLAVVRPRDGTLAEGTVGLGEVVVGAARLACAGSETAPEQRDRDPRGTVPGVDLAAAQQGVGVVRVEFEAALVGQKGLIGDAVRKQIVPDCVVLTPDNLAKIAYWMPGTCAYRLLWEGKTLKDWHPLISGDPDSVHAAGISVKGWTVPEFELTEDDWEDHIIDDIEG